MWYWPVTVGNCLTPVDTRKLRTMVLPSYAYKVCFERFTSIQRTPPIVLMTALGVSVGNGISVSVGRGVSVGINVSVGEGVSVGVAVSIGVGVDVAVALGVKVDVKLGV